MHDARLQSRENCSNTLWMNEFWPPYVSDELTAEQWLIANGWLIHRHPT